MVLQRAEAVGYQRPSEQRGSDQPVPSKAVLGYERVPVKATRAGVVAFAAKTRWRCGLVLQRLWGGVQGAILWCKVCTHSRAGFRANSVDLEKRQVVLTCFRDRAQGTRGRSCLQPLAGKVPLLSTNPYEKADFYASAIAAGRHRAIVGGRWEETGRIAMQILQGMGLLPHHHLLDIGAGALRLGCKAVPYLEPGHYWATDASRAIMLAGWRVELADPMRLDPAHLIEDARFEFPGIPDQITHAIAFAVFPHLPLAQLKLALTNLRRFERLDCFLFTVFLAPDPVALMTPYRQADGVVTHHNRAPFHILAEDVHQLARSCGWRVERREVMLPRGQALFAAQPVRG